MNDRCSEKTRLIDSLSQTGADAVARGLTQASGGNLSARLSADLYLITRSGAWLNRLRAEDFVEMRIADATMGISGGPSSEWRMHREIYSLRSDVEAIVHLHPQRAVLLDALGYRIRMLTLDHAFYVRSVGRVDYAPNGSMELARSVAQETLDHNCVVLGNHGCSTVGGSIDMAYRRALSLEEAATMTYRALLLGDSTTEMSSRIRDEMHHA